MNKCEPSEHSLSGLLMGAGHVDSGDNADQAVSECIASEEFKNKNKRE